MDDERDVGLLAAGRYARLTMRALLGAAAARHHLLPRLGPMQRYLLSNAVLYGVLALAFLGHWPPVQVGKTGLAWVDDPIPHTLWGLTVLVVSVSQIAVLFTPRWAVWQFCAVITAMWAGAFGMATLVVGLQVHSYGGIAIWFWVVHVHLLLVGNHLVPVAFANTEHVETADERALAAKLTRMLNDSDGASHAFVALPRG